MKRALLVIVLNLFFCCATVIAQENQKSELEQRAEDDSKNGKMVSARSNYIRAFGDYANKGMMKQAV